MCGDPRVSQTKDLSILCSDVVEEIAMHLTLKDLYVFVLTCKRFSSLNDCVWDNLCVILYPKEFWIKAIQRPASMSKPLGTSKKELERLKKFESVMLGEGLIWTLEDYYKMWNYLDNSA